MFASTVPVDPVAMTVVSAEVGMNTASDGQPPGYGAVMPLNVLWTTSNPVAPDPLRPRRHGVCRLRIDTGVVFDAEQAVVRLEADALEPECPKLDAPRLRRRSQ